MNTMQVIQVKYDLPRRMITRLRKCLENHWEIVFHDECKQASHFPYAVTGVLNFPDGMSFCFRREGYLMEEALGALLGKVEEFNNLQSKEK